MERKQIGDIPIGQFEPGVINIVKRKQTATGRVTSSLITQIPCVIYEGRLSDDNIPDGWHRLETSGTDWSCDDDNETIIKEFKEHKADIVGRHLEADEFDEILVKCEFDPEDDSFYDELRPALNYSLMDADEPAIEGFEETLKKNVWVNFWNTVLVKMSFEDILAKSSNPSVQYVDVETGYTDPEDCGVWEDFKNYVISHFDE